MTDYFNTVTVDPDFPQVTLDISRNYPSDPLTIYRTDTAGSRLVRLPEGFDEHQNNVTVIDHDAALGPVTYLTYSGDSADVDLSAHHRLPVFSLPFTPTIRLTVPSVTVFDGPRTSPSAVHEVIDRRYPLATIRPLSGRRGRLEALVYGWQAVKDLEALLELGQLVHYREADNPGMDAHMVITGTTPSRIGNRLWRVEVNWTETAPPTGGYNQYDWTFADLREAHPTFTLTSQAYASFNDLTAGGRL